MFEIISICKGGGYRYCRTRPRHPRANAMGLYPLHRVRMENKLGRLLEPGEVVHHLNGDKADDEPVNLALMQNADHARFHQKGRLRVSIYSCFQCGGLFSAKVFDYTKRLRRNKMGRAFCSRSCGASFQAMQREARG